MGHSIMNQLGYIIKSEHYIQEVQSFVKSTEIILTERTMRSDDILDR